jgi:hypothetical protein
MNVIVFCSQTIWVIPFSIHKHRFVQSASRWDIVNNVINFISCNQQQHQLIHQSPSEYHNAKDCIAQWKMEQNLEEGVLLAQPIVPPNQ